MFALFLPVLHIDTGYIMAVGGLDFMQLASLSEIIEEPEFHRLLLHGYAGPYSLGVIGSNRVLLSLPNVPDSATSIPHEVEFKGLHILIDVKRDWAQPHKLTYC